MNQHEMLVDHLMNIPTRLCRNMSYRFISSCLKDVDKDLSQHHFMILKLLDDNQNLYVTEIVDQLSITKSQMTASADKLIQKGYVERLTDAKDRRKIYLSITESGTAITSAIKESIEVKINNNLLSLSEKEQDDLVNGLNVLFKFCSL